MKQGNGRGQDDGGGKYGWGGADARKEQEEEEPEEQQPQELANFGLSGKLAKDQNTGNVYKGVVLKWQEPEEARPPTKKWRLYVFKGQATVATLHIHRQSAYLVGREKRVADIVVDHPSCSKQHAVIQFRLFEKVDEKEGTTRRSVRWVGGWAAGVRGLGLEVEGSGRVAFGVAGGGGDRLKEGVLFEKIDEG
eukprot:jgi/Undpi1/2782/HiC_scaffold_14.g06159.m1